MEEKQLINLAFNNIHSIPYKNIEEVISENPFIDDNSHSYSDGDFGLNENTDSKIRPTSGMKLLRINILITYKKIKPDFTFTKPRRTLTSPEEGVSNNDLDNCDCNLIVGVEDIIPSTKYKFTVIDLIGQGGSGQVFEVVDNENNRFALKIIKNKKVYRTQALLELKILHTLNTSIDINDIYHIIRIHDYFFFHEHLCIVFELLNENLYQLLQQNHFQGISLNSIRFITKQILEAIEQIHKANIIHCDMKPENILLKIDKEGKNLKGEISIKVTDFGSACDKSNPMFTYIQSRYYRAPEVILGSSYSSAIDIWSIGLIAAELYLGNPLLPGACAYDQLVKIEALLGEFPQHLLKGRNLKKFYKVSIEQKKTILKTSQEYYNEFPNDLRDKKYQIPFDMQSIDDLINIKRDSKVKRSNNTNRSCHNMSNSSFNNNDDLCSFIHFLKGLLNLDPQSRWTAKQCLRHPFITKEKLDTYISHNIDESQFLYLSNNNTNLKMNKLHNSMVYNFSPNNSISFEMNKQMNYNCNNSNICYQPNLSNIHMNWMRNFPFAKVDQCDLKGNNNINPNMNRTFMMSSFDNLNLSANDSYNNIIMNNNSNNSNNYYQNNNHKKEKEHSKFKNQRQQQQYQQQQQVNIASNSMNDNYMRSEKRGKTIEYPSCNMMFANNNNILNGPYPFISNNNEDYTAFNRQNPGGIGMNSNINISTRRHTSNYPSAINQSYDPETYIKHLNNNSQINEEDNHNEEDNKLIFDNKE